MKKKSKASLLRHDDLPASVGLVKEVRDELRAEIRSVEHALNAKIAQVDSKVAQVESKVAQLDSKIAQVDSKVAQLDSKIAQVDSKVEHLSSKVEKVIVSVHRTQVLMEEQRGENRIVLDGIKTLIERQDRMENDLDKLRDSVHRLGQRR